MAIKETKIDLTFKYERGKNEYYHAKNFHNPQLKYLTIDKLVKIFKEAAYYYEDTVIEFPHEVFNYSDDLLGELTLEQLNNPTEDLCSTLLKGISTTLAYDTSPYYGLTLDTLAPIAKTLTKEELFELLNHLAFPYYRYGDYYIGITNLEVVETDLGDYFKWYVQFGDGDFSSEGVTTFTTLDKDIDFTKCKTVKELKEFLETIPEDTELPNLTFKYNEDN